MSDAPLRLDQPRGRDAPVDSSPTAPSSTAPSGSPKMPPRSVPVTMLSGFLGAGKTTLLRHLLKQDKRRYGCVVNDLASVNVDVKELAQFGRGSTADLSDTIELSNGCACCSITEELFGAFANLVRVSDRRELPYDRIVLENSGVAEPQNIRDQFNDAIAAGLPLMQRIHLDSLITVVDGSTFIAQYVSRAPLAARPDLGEGGSLRPVVDLLVEQIECADYVILNKMDLMPDEEARASLRSIVSSLNPLARVVEATQGDVDVDLLFGDESQALMARINTEGQHRSAVAAAKATEKELEEEEKKKQKVGEHGESKGHGHDHDGHGHGHDGHGHGHGHDHDGHDHAHDHAHDKHDHSHGEENCQACKHEHDHDHDHAHGKHEHDHDHDHAHGKHDHSSHDHSSHDHSSHDHSHDSHETTAARRFGITSFVYSRRRPFDQQRLKDLVLRWMPVSHNKAVADGEAAVDETSPLRTVLRSKGFMWAAGSNDTAFYWSHAGQHFEIRDEGEWWAACDDEDWPEAGEQRNVVLQDFDPDTGFGDRRQEIVFIGANMDREAIERQLDSALLKDDEFAAFAEATPSDPEHPGVPSHAH